MGWLQHGFEDAEVAKGGIAQSKTAVSDLKRTPRGGTLEGSARSRSDLTAQDLTLGLNAKT
jgi:hypothetical protein